VNTWKSSSEEQVNAEKIMALMLEEQLGVKLEKNRKIVLNQDNDVYVVPDIYSETALIIGEIYAHIGKLKPAQNHKITNDILKMLLLEKITGKCYKKIIAVCDTRVMKSIQGKSALAEAIRQFEVEVICLEIDENTKNQIVIAQERQKMING